MMTELSKVLRTIRLNNGEILKSMSDKLGVTSSYLSAVENGKRPMPNGWAEEIVRLYNLDRAAMENIQIAADKLTKSIKIEMEGSSYAKRDTALVFARTFDSMDDELALSIKKLLNKDGE